MTWVWVEEPEVLAIHEAQLAEHGGIVGVRDHGLLLSALARPKNLDAYDQPDLAALAASYGFGVAKNHPFVDGNKRTAFVAMELFIELNGHALNASDPSCVETMLSVADGTLPEAQLADWIRSNLGAAP